MILNPTRNEWICNCHESHPVPMSPLFNDTVVECSVTGTKYHIQWRFKHCGDDEFAPLPEDEMLILDPRNGRWVCPERHEHGLGSGVLSERDQLSCPVTGHVYEFNPSVDVETECEVENTD